MSEISSKQAWTLLKQYNKEEFHLLHARTVALVMRWFAEHEGFEAEADFWETVGLLHDIDYELYPDEHCKKAPELLRNGGADEKLIHAVVSHGFGHCSEVEPEHHMEKVLFAADELTGLIWAAALMRPSKSVSDMELKSLKKKYKDKERSFTSEDEAYDYLYLLNDLDEDIENVSPKRVKEIVNSEKPLTPWQPMRTKSTTLRTTRIKYRRICSPHGVLVERSG